jgi:glucose-6-phosphate 1-dehydrogenase
MDQLISWKIRKDVTQMWEEREAAAEATERGKSGPTAAAQIKN